MPVARLSSPIQDIKSHYTVVVIGSGYGGGIAASRMARAGQQVCVLERGKEWQPGEYPDTLLEAAPEMQTDLPQAHLGPDTGLYDLRVNEDINVFLGCGLGGTSLLNANVALRAEPRIFDDPRWPQALRDDLHTRLEEGYRRAEEMLKPTPYPPNFPPLPKLQALEKSAQGMGEKFYRPPINVTFKDGVNHVGVEQQACKLCGDCCSGCNYAAKNTVLMNYLPDAWNHGAEIFTQVSVRRIEREGKRWLVHYSLLGAGRERFDAPTMCVEADVVILAAGTLGSTEILLRSKAAGLALSDRVGHHFSGNGDVVAFGYNNDVEINSTGFGQHPEAAKGPVGPCITGIIDVREQEVLNDGYVIEEGSIPSPLATILPGAFATAATISGIDTDAGARDRIREKVREGQSLLLGPYRGAVRNTQTYLVMTHDDSAGRMYLDDDRLRISYPGVGKQPIFERVDKSLEDATRVLGGTYVRNPVWSDLMGKDLVTVHPLGGCSMSEDAEGGVVNHKGQVFSGATGTEVYEDLYVADGSVIPRSLGVNPLLTISAVAERCCALLAQDRAWHIDYTLPSKPSRMPAPHRLGIQFTEKMRGYFGMGALDSYEAGAEQGKLNGSPLQFTLTITGDDLDGMLKGEDHRAGIVGTVEAPALSPEPLTVEGGDFNLFVSDPDAAGTRLMRYRMRLRSEEGRTYYFDGFKRVHNDPGLDVWPDTTTLYITLYSGDSEHCPALGKGILRIHPADFMRQMTTMKVTHARGIQERLEATARFGTYFAGTLFEVYGGVFARPFAPNRLPGEDTPRKKRELRVDAPETHAFTTADGVQLRLTRYMGGAKGPVMLAHGLGVSSLIFSIDTIGTNLLEYLFANGYDVWLLDYRASIALPTSTAPQNADDVALMDYPAAVRYIRETAGVESVQVVAHCFGAITFSMAMLGGLRGVRSAVLSQAGMHTVTPILGRAKAGLHLPSMLENLGIESLTAYAGRNPDWRDRLFSRALEILPGKREEECDNPVCPRITFMYGHLYRHSRLNPATHNALHEMFGVASIDSFEHVACMVRAGHVVNADGRDNYMPNLQRMAIPLAFIHGAENGCWLPESTQRSYDALRAANGPELYTRHVIPGYGHIDCIFGEDAAEDVYPLILRHLEETQ